MRLRNVVGFVCACVVLAGNVAAEDWWSKGAPGSREWREPVAAEGSLPSTGKVGEVRLVTGDSTLRYWSGSNWEEIGSSYSPSRTVTVDAEGADFTSVKAACDYVATQARSASTQWLIEVHGGAAGAGSSYANRWNYQEGAAFTVPSYTSLQGVTAGHNTPVGWTGSPIVQLTATSGTLVTLAAGSSISNLYFVYYATPTAAVTVFDFSGAASDVGVLTNVSFTVLPLSAAQPVTGVKNSGGGGLYLYDTSLTFGPLNHADTIVLKNESAVGISLYGGRFVGGSNCAKLMESSAGPLKLYWARIDQACTTDLTASGSGTVQVIGTPYLTASGTITHADGTQGIQFCKTYSGTGSPEGVLTAPACSTYFNRSAGTGTTFYVKESGSGNTGWVAK